MSELITRLRELRANTYANLREVVDGPAEENRMLTGTEEEALRSLTANLDNLDERIEAVTEQEKRADDTSAALGRLGGSRRPSMSAQDQDLAKAFRSAIRAKNPAPIEVHADLTDSWPDDLPEVARGNPGRVRVHQGPGVEYRDTLKTTATQAMRTTVYDSLVEHMVETSAVMKAGATIVTTSTGEDLQIPKSSAFVSSAITAEGASIVEGDPTLGAVTLKAFKYGSYFELSQELANDTPTNLLDYLGRAAVTALSLGATGYGNDLINGVGTTAPRGILLDSILGVTLPTGTGTSLGTQGTANQGTDALWNLVGSLAEPYASAPKAGFIMRNASDIIVRKLRDTTGQPVQGLGERGRILGYPSYLDPFMPAMANTAKSAVFGDFSRFFIRIVNGFRFERSDDFRFQNDLVAFRCLVRLDAATIDLTGALKHWVNTT